MMKKNGFTLAEVLITLSIIGVVASLTLPTLMTNTAEQQARTGLRKAINTITEVGNMANALDGYDLSGAVNDDHGVDDASVYSIFSRHAAMDVGASVASSATTMHGPDDAQAIVFRDGTAVIYNPALTFADGVGTYQDDNLPAGFLAVIDTNGLKGPNFIANCMDGATATTEMNLALAEAPDGGADADPDACETKSQRQIKDQFYVQIRGTQVIPLGSAAKWALSK